MRWPHTARAALLGSCLVGVAGMSACGRDALAPEPTGISILFIGNTYSAINDLPGAVEALLDSVGPRPNHTFGEIMLGLSLEDHWVLQTGQDWINMGGWDYVIMQQGPSETVGGKRILLKYAQNFAPLIRAVGAKPGFWQIWPVPDSADDYDGIYASYKEVADSIGGFIIPAANTWREALAMDSSLAFYEDDHLVPTPLGGYAIALTIAAGLSHKDPSLFPDGVTTPNGITLAPGERVAAIIKTAAAKVLAGG